MGCRSTAPHMGATDLVQGAPHMGAPTQPGPWLSRRSYDLDGTDDYLHRAAGLAAFPQAFTVSQWVKPGVDAALSYLWDFRDGVDRCRGWRRGDHANDEFEVNFLGQTLRMPLSAAGALTVGTWQHVALTRDGSNVCRIYLDGAEGDVSGVTAAGVVPTADCSVCANFVGASTFTGRSSQLGVLSRALTGPEIAALAANPDYDLAHDPDSYLALNATHRGDDTSSGGIVHDWVAARQDFVPTNMDAADIVDDAP